MKKGSWLLGLGLSLVTLSGCNVNFRDSIPDPVPGGTVIKTREDINALIIQLKSEHTELTTLKIHEIISESISGDEEEIIYLDDIEIDFEHQWYYHSSTFVEDDFTDITYIYKDGDIYSKYSYDEEKDEEDEVIVDQAYFSEETSKYLYESGATLEVNDAKAQELSIKQNIIKNVDDTVIYSASFPGIDSFGDDIIERISFETLTNGYLSEYKHTSSDGVTLTAMSLSFTYNAYLTQPILD
jgi:hypothetical protein